MRYSLQKHITSVEDPPIAQAQSWLNPARFGDERPLIDLSQAVPNYHPPAAISHTISKLSRDREAGFYTDILGIAPLREAIAREMGGHAAHVDASNVAVTAGCNQAYSVVMQALLGAGDEVIMPLPWYFNHRMYLDMLGARAVGVPVDESALGVPALSEIEKHIGERTRAIMIVSPNNPVGAIYPPRFIDELNTLAREHDLALVIDETYRDFIADPALRHRLFDRSDWSENVVQLYSFSKSFGMTGYRVGSVVASTDLINQIVKILDCQTICAPAISQHAALTGLTECGEFREQKCRMMETRLHAIRQAFARPGLKFHLISSGAYFAYVQHPFSQSAVDVARRLASEHNILVLPGSMFGPGQESCLRLAFANVDSDRFEEVIDRLALATEAMSDVLRADRS